MLALYLFGSRAADGLRALRGEAVDAAGSDLGDLEAFARELEAAATRLA